MLPILGWDEEVSLIEQAIDRLGQDLSILEAGCGQQWPLKLSCTYKLVGVDEDESALKARVAQRGDLDAYQVRSIGGAEFAPQSFDVIYCSYVLEHVVGVDKVLANFATWIRPGGLIILRVPDGSSVYGFLARHTPHWMHVAVKRYVYGMKDAGKPGHDPYPVVYEPAMSRGALAEFCERRGYSVSITANDSYLRGSWWIKALVVTVSWLSLGRLPWKYNNLTFVIRA
jgi:SAM-dependent methyltransferase